MIGEDPQGLTIFYVMSDFTASEQLYLVIIHSLGHVGFKLHVHLGANRRQPFTSLSMEISSTKRRPGSGNHLIEVVVRSIETGSRLSHSPNKHVFTNAEEDLSENLLFDGRACHSLELSCLISLRWRGKSSTKIGFPMHLWIMGTDPQGKKTGFEEPQVWINNMALITDHFPRFGMRQNFFLEHHSSRDESIGPGVDQIVK